MRSPIRGTGIGLLRSVDGRYKADGEALKSLLLLTRAGQAMLRWRANRSELAFRPMCAACFCSAQLIPAAAVAVRAKLVSSRANRRRAAVLRAAEEIVASAASWDHVNAGDVDR